MEKIKVAVISCGLRSVKVVSELLKAGAGKVEIASIYDPDASEIKYAKGKLGIPDALECTSFAQAIAVPGVSWVLIFSPNVFHKQYILEAFAAGKHVFSEKPIATTIEDCQAIYEAHQKSGLLFATGFVLRYSPVYARVRQLLDSGDFGRLMSVDACECIPPFHGGYIMANWRRRTEWAGPHILEKCCHDLDLINWFVGSKVSRCASFGSRDFFTPEHAGYYEKYGSSCFGIWRDPHSSTNPFSGDTDLLDNQVCIMEYRNGVKAQFNCTMSNTIPVRRLRLTLERGNIEAELYTATVRHRLLGEAITHNDKIDTSSAGHGGGDPRIAAGLVDSMVNGTVPACGGNEGLESAVVAIALDQAAHGSGLVDLEPIWKKLGR